MPTMILPANVSYPPEKFSFREFSTLRRKINQFAIFFTYSPVPNESGCDGWGNFLFRQKYRPQHPQLLRPLRTY